MARDSNRISTPVISNGKMTFISNRVATCVDAVTGMRLYQGRMGGGSSHTEADSGRRPGRGGGGRGGQDYSSPVIADGKLYFVTRSGDMHVLKLGDRFDQLATNHVTEDAEDFSASPAVSDRALFVRSSAYLYCIAEEKK